MSSNWLLTGPPGSGKSTALERAAEQLQDRGYAVRGLVSPEIRSLGHRVGFEIVDLASDESATLAHMDRDQGPSVGKYRVDVEAVDRISEQAIGEEAREAADVILIDEIAPMEVMSDVFVDETRTCLDAELPVIGTVHQRGPRRDQGARGCRGPGGERGYAGRAARRACGVGPVSPRGLGLTLVTSSPAIEVKSPSTVAGGASCWRAWLAMSKSDWRHSIPWRRWSRCSSAAPKPPLKFPPGFQPPYGRVSAQ